MKKKRILKIVIILAVAGIITIGGIGLYMFNMPHRDVQNTDTDYRLTTTEIVSEYLSDKNGADEKYLSEDGNSKVLEITGTVSEITDDYNGAKVLVLKENDAKAGVRCTFTPETENHLKDVTTGTKVTVKGVIRSGASYDEDLEMYENVILEKCDIISK